MLLKMLSISASGILETFFNIIILLGLAVHVLFSIRRNQPEMLISPFPSQQESNMILGNK